MSDKSSDLMGYNSDMQSAGTLVKAAETTGKELLRDLCALYHSRLKELINKKDTLSIINYLNEIKSENKFGVFGKNDFLAIFNENNISISDFGKYGKLFSGLDDEVIGFMVKRINDECNKSVDEDKIALANAILENIESFKNVKNVSYHSSVEDGTVIITLGGEKFPPIYFGDLPVNFMRIVQNGWGSDFLNSLIEKNVDLIVSDIKNTIKDYKSYLSKLGKDFVNLKLYINNNLIKNIDDLNKSSVYDLLENRLSKILKIEDPVEKIIQLRNLRLRISQFDASYEPYKTFSK